MQSTTPDPNPIPPELPTDPSRIPPDVPINTPPEKGPRRPEPLPPKPVPPMRARNLFGMVVLLGIAVLAGPALAQKPAGKDTSGLERPNPQQSKCSQISDADERAACLKQNEPSGEPALGKPPAARQPPPMSPSVGREMKPAPADRQAPPTNPDAPALSR